MGEGNLKGKLKLKRKGKAQWESSSSSEKGIDLRYVK